MAEQNPQSISPDQHRADLAELRLEFKEEMHGVRQDVAVLSKSVEQVAQMVVDLRTHMDRQFAQVDQQFAQVDQRFDRVDQRFAQVDQQFDRVNQQFDRVDRQFTDLRQDLRELRTTTQRQLWVMIAVVMVTMVGGMVKITFFP